MCMNVNSFLANCHRTMISDSEEPIITYYPAGTGNKDGKNVIGEIDDSEYLRILKKQELSLKRLCDDYKYTGREIHLRKYTLGMEIIEWVEEMKSHLLRAAKNQVYEDVIKYILDLEDYDQMISNRVYGIDNKFVTKMSGKEVTDEVERYFRVKEVMITLEKICESFGFEEIANEVYEECKHDEMVTKLIDEADCSHEQFNMYELNFVYQWFIVRKFGTYETKRALDGIHPKLVEMDELYSGKTISDIVTTKGLTLETLKDAISEILEKMKANMKKEYVSEAWSLIQAVGQAAGTMEDGAAEYVMRIASVEASNMIYEKREVNFPELWKKIDLPRLEAEGKLFRKRLIPGNIRKGVFISYEEIEKGSGGELKRDRDENERYGNSRRFGNYTKNNFKRYRYGGKRRRGQERYTRSYGRPYREK